MIGVSDILKLTKQLLPTGRAWKVPRNSQFEKLLEGLAESEVRAYNFSLSILDRLLPDNENFTAEDATQWERRLGLPVSPSLASLEERKSIILRKYQFPGGFLNRQNYKYIEYQLKLAGFNVTVTENTDPDLILGTAFQHGIDVEMGLNTEMGSTEIDLIANSAFQGELYDISSPLGVFIISGTVPPLLINTFRKLVLTLKPINTVAMLNVGYSETVYTYLEDGMFLFDGIYLMD